MLKTIFNHMLTRKLSTYLKQSKFKNPYMNLHQTTLSQLLKTQCQDPKFQHPIQIHKINKLILIGNACSQHYKNINEIYLNKLLRYCMVGIVKIHDNLMQIEESSLKELELEELFGFVNRVSALSMSNAEHEHINKLTQYYINTYSHIYSLNRHLNIYAQIRDNPKFNQIKHLCQAIIKKKVTNVQQFINLQIFIKYLRFFRSQVTKQEIEDRLIYFAERPALCSLPQQYKLLFLYFTKLYQIDESLVDKFEIHVDLIIGGEDSPKQILLKLQIIKWSPQNQQIPDLTSLCLDSWNFQSLVWLSQFTKTDKQKQFLHSTILSHRFPLGTSPFSILTYAENAGLTATQHISLRDWILKQQNIFRSQNQDQLCQIILQMHEKHWFGYYRQFYLQILNRSLGNYKWENKNIIYYVGVVEKVEHQNMEYIRRYILNTYAALGTARREIPTSSYFYKILGVTNVQKFYGNL